MSRLKMFEPRTIPKPNSWFPCRKAAIEEEISGASAPSAAMIPNSDSDSRSHLPSCLIRWESTALAVTVRIKLPMKRSPAPMEHKMLLSFRLR
jgi:hypothetical protein